MDNVTSFAAGLILGLILHATYGAVVEAKKMDKVDSELARMRRRDGGIAWKE